MVRDGRPQKTLDHLSRDRSAADGQRPVACVAGGGDREAIELPTISGRRRCDFTVIQ